MSKAYGRGNYRYQRADWQAHFPDGWTPVEVNALTIDSQDRLYAFNTGEYPVTVFDRDGQLLGTWGQGRFGHSHGALIGPDDTIYCTDDGNHTVKRFTLDGKLLMTLGKKDQPSDTGYTLVDPEGKPIFIMDAIKTTKRGGPPFNSPTGVALASNGDIFVSDGYGNARVHKFSPDGTLLKSWGEPGGAPGEFFVPHGIAVDKDDRVLVVDRHNNRIQIFDTDGNYLTEWTGFELPSDVFIDRDQAVYITELMPRLSILDTNGNVLARLDNEGTTKEDPLFVTLHSVTVDSRGDVYVAEVMGIYQNDPFLDTRKTRMIHKFIRQS